MVRSAPDTARGLAQAAIAFIVMTLAALLVAGVTPAAAVAVPSRAVATYAYNSPQSDQLRTHTTTERGPPAAHGQGRAYDAADRLSDGALAYPDMAMARSTYTYDYRASLVRVACVGTTTTTTTTTATAAEVSPAALSPLMRWHVAAKGATSSIDDLLRPGGSLIGKAGTSGSIRELSGGLSEAQTMFGQLSQGGRIVSQSVKLTRVELPNGGFVQLRTVMSRSPGTEATIDVNIPGLNITKLKFIP